MFNKSIISPAVLSFFALTPTYALSEDSFSGIVDEAVPIVVAITYIIALLIVLVLMWNIFKLNQGPDANAGETVKSRIIWGVFIIFMLGSIFSLAIAFLEFFTTSL